MQYLFHSWESFAAGIRSATHVLLLSDYDGTLTPIVDRPDDAILSPSVSEKLRALSKNPAFSVGIVSGRSLSEIRAMVGISGIYYAGNHGLEMEGPGLNFVSPASIEARTITKDLVRQLSAGLADIEGVIIEDKGLGLSLHYRLVKPDEEQAVADIFHQTASPLLREGKIRITSGKKIWEVRPPIDWHKGKAVETIQQAISTLVKPEKLTTVSLGDDTTDEDAFRVVHHPQGWSIYIGQEKPSSNAGYFLNSTSEVLVFLSRLLELK